MRLFKFALVSFLICFACSSIAQTSCPNNIDFSTGDFTNWKCSTGVIQPAAGTVVFNAFLPVTGRQTLFANTYTGMDPYGNFPVVAPNGSKYTLKLGNSISGAQAEQVSYTYTIPTNNYIITYYYAVVLQLTTDHADYQRPRFTVKLTDSTTNEVINCGTHNFISGDGLGNFKKSASGQGVEYRDWSTVAVTLAGRQGHVLKFDFTTNDCSRGGHFGYAYLAFDDPCVLNKDPITGIQYCTGASTVTLTAPPGFDQYIWKKVGSPDVLNSSQKYILPDIPPDGTQYTVDAESFTGVGQGCPATFTATIKSINEQLVFKVNSPPPACVTSGIDITQPAITAGSASNVTFKYYVDSTQQVVVRDPTHVTTPGRYYIKGTNTYGCADLLSIDLKLQNDPSIKIVTPPLICAPATVDLTTVGGTINPGLTYGYYSDAAATLRLTNPRKISASGTYYIKTTNSAGCYAISPVNVSILPIPYVKPITIKDCGPVDATLPAYHTDDTGNLIYKYFKDAGTAIPVDDPTKITESGVYYVVGTNELGCTTLAPVPFNIQLYPRAVLQITQPATVVFPTIVDLTKTYIPSAGYTYSYYTDSAATTPLINYQTVANTGKYYIKAVNGPGCQTIQEVTATINPPDYANLDAKNTFTPNGDGTNDEFTPKLVGAPKVNYLKIYSRNGALVFQTTDVNIHWKGTINGNPLPTGTYYWVFSCYDIFYKQDVVKSGAVTIIR